MHERLREEKEVWKILRGPIARAHFHHHRLVGWSAGRLGHLYIDGCNPMIVVLVAIYLFLFLYIGSRCVAETGSVTFARSFDS